MLAVMLSCAILSGSAFIQTYAVLEGAKIELSLSSERVLRGEFLVVSGRLSTVDGDHPIALATVRLQYYRVGDTSFTRELTLISSNPGGLFEDRLNTTSLLKIGTWVVNASFPSQMGYEGTFALKTFVIVVQPSLSLYVSVHKLALGESIEVNGLLFACIPCIDDQIALVFVRPDGTTNTMEVKMNPVGGPYPGGYYNATFKPDVAGRWNVRAVWEGNDVTLPAYSQVETFDVEASNTSFEAQSIVYAGLTILAAAAVAVVLLALMRRRHRPFTS